MRWLVLPLILTALLARPSQAAELTVKGDMMVILLKNAWVETEKAGAPNPKFGVHAFDTDVVMTGPDHRFRFLADPAWIAHTRAR